MDGELVDLVHPATDPSPASSGEGAEAEAATDNSGDEQEGQGGTVDGGILRIQTTAAGPSQRRGRSGGAANFSGEGQWLAAGSFGGERRRSGEAGDLMRSWRGHSAIADPGQSRIIDNF